MDLIDDFDLLNAEHREEILSAIEHLESVFKKPRLYWARRNTPRIDSKGNSVPPAQLEPVSAYWDSHKKCVYLEILGSEGRHELENWRDFRPLQIPEN